MTFDDTLGSFLWGEMLCEAFLERFAEEVEDPSIVVPTKVEKKYVTKRDTEGMCTYIHIPGGYVVVEDWRGRYGLYETAEKTALRNHLSAWARFSRGCWLSSAPSKPGVYPTRSRTGFRAKDREIVDFDGRLKDVSGGYSVSGKVTEWAGEWWSEAYPPLPGAK
jgi:hypothetical protein